MTGKTQAHTPFRYTRQAAQRRAAEVWGTKLTETDVEALIAIAAETSPSGVQVKVLAYLALHRPDLYRDRVLTTLLSYATRWLAVIWRDEGREAFQRAARAWKEEVAQ